MPRRLYIRKGKTTRKTGRKRVIPLTEALAATLRPLAARYAEGPILRNTRGEPWTENAVNTQMRRLRGRLERAGKETPELVPYSLRHLFATDALDSGVPLATLATMMGNSPEIIMKRYSHLIERPDHILEALDRVRGDGAKEPGGSGPAGGP